MYHVATMNSIMIQMLIPKSCATWFLCLIELNHGWQYHVGGEQWSEGGVSEAQGCTYVPIQSTEFP
jgi:hypothetical protein